MYGNFVANRQRRDDRDGRMLKMLADGLDRPTIRERLGITNGRYDASLMRLRKSGALKGTPA